jgi:hypothetical protein
LCDRRTGSQHVCRRHSDKSGHAQDERPENRRSRGNTTRILSLRRITAAAGAPIGARR